MIKKRLIGVVTICGGLAVQSIGYRRYLPLGNPMVIVENLDRWGVDEILIQCIDRSRNNLGPNFKLLKYISSLGLSTPLIYAGGIRNSIDAVEVIRTGADRVAVDAILWDSPLLLQQVSCELGAQALIINMPVSICDKKLLWMNYRGSDALEFNKCNIDFLDSCIYSELMLTDWRHDGFVGEFDEKILDYLTPINKSLIVFGGISNFTQVNRLLAKSNVVAVGIGNSLNYKEHAVQYIKNNVSDVLLRPSHYKKEKYFL